jgi:hypothetical protein
MTAAVATAALVAAVVGSGCSVGGDDGDGVGVVVAVAEYTSIN